MFRKIMIIGLVMALINVLGGVSTKCEALSMRVTEGSAAELIRFAAREGNINVIIDSGADSHVSVNFQDISPREAINKIVQACGLSIGEREGTLIIGKGKNIVSQLGQVYVIPVAYGDLEELKKEAELYCPKVEVDINTHSLLVYGTAEDAREVNRLLKKVDVPAPQVSLEAKVVAMKREDLEKLGVTWEWTKIPHNFTYDATLDLLISKGKAKLLSRPNIVTMQGREAVINIGGDVPIPEVSVTNTTTTTSIKYRPAGILLQCRPFVNDEGYIDTQLNIEVSAPSYVKEMNAYSFQKRSAQTRVRLKDGETLVIGGLISREEVKQLQKIPFLGDIPILGNFFKATSSKVTEEELTIFIKATIL